MSIYSQITSNKIRTWVIMVFFVAFVTTLIYVYSKATGGGLSIAGFALILSGLMSLGSYYYSDKIILTMSNAKQIQKKDNPELFRTVENLCIGDGLPMPKIYIIQDSAPNAFATGRDPKHAVVCGTIAFLADIFRRSMWFRGRDREDRGNSQAIFMLIGIVLAILSPIIATLIQLAISRKREFLADASGVLLTRYPEGLASALEKISRDREPLEAANNATAHLYIVNPFKGKEIKSFLAGLFNTHPPIEDRIKILRSM